MTAESGAFDFSRAAALLTDTAARAGAAIMERFHGNAEVKLKDDASPVTLADKDSEAIILDALTRLAPEIPVVSEEAVDGRPAALGSRFFLVDPLDGTKEFIKKRSDFTVNIALIEQGRPSFGLVYAPARSLLAVTAAPGEAIEAELAPSTGGADLAKLHKKTLEVRVARPRRPDGAGQPLPSRPRDRGVPGEAQDRQALGRRLFRQVPGDRPG